MGGSWERAMKYESLPGKIRRVWLNWNPSMKTSKTPQASPCYFWTLAVKKHENTSTAVWTQRETNTSALWRGESRTRWLIPRTFGDDSGDRHGDTVLRVVVAVWLLANEVETPSTQVAGWHTDSVFLHCFRQEHRWSLWLKFKEFRSRSRYWWRRKHHRCRHEIIQSGHADCQGVLFWHRSDRRL